MIKYVDMAAWQDGLEQIKAELLKVVCRKDIHEFHSGLIMWLRPMSDWFMEAPVPLLRP